MTIRDGVHVTCAAGYLGYQTGSTGVATVAGSGSTWTVNGPLAVGYLGSGTLSITGGATVNSVGGTVGAVSGSTGVAIVDGPGSTWNTGAEWFWVGYQGSGKLSITRGGNVTCPTFSVEGGAVTVDGTGSTLAYDGGPHIGGMLSITNGGVFGSGTFTNYVSYIEADGIVAVDGAGSTWKEAATIEVQASGGMLSITGGGSVSAKAVILDSASLLAVNVGRGSSLTVGGGAGTLTNNGTIRVVAGAGIAADGRNYSPIAANTWSGTGNYQAIGGTWSATGHTFTASSVASGTSSTPVSLDLKSVQRALIDDNAPGGTNWEIGASFIAAGNTTNMTFTATAMDHEILDTLGSQLPPDDAILSGWMFSTTGYAVSPTNPIYLSFNVGAKHPADDLEVWHYDGSTWTGYSPTDLTYDGTYASFTATGLSGYAMVAVPEPDTLVLLAAGLFGLLAYAWRKRPGPIT